MNVLVIPEDFLKDQYILKPIITAMFAAIGRSTATVRVCQAPRLRGIAQAMDWNRIEQIIRRYRGMVHLFLLCVDRDGDPGRRMALDNLEVRAQQILPPERLFLAEHAWQELEVWVLAGHRLPRGWQWTDVRREVNPKERFFVPFADQRGVSRHESGGREALALEAARRYARIRQRCREDVQTLEARIKSWLDGSPP